MLSIDHIRTIARRQHQQGVACVAIEAHDFSVQIRIDTGEQPATAAAVAIAAAAACPQRELLKSQHLGIASFPAPLNAGQTIAAGQVLLHLTVGNTMHEVTATKHAQISAILIESGALVDWGMPLIELAPLTSENSSAAASPSGEAACA